MYGKELRDALGSFPGGYVANGGDAGLAADHGKSNLANFQIRGVAQLDASADIYLDGNATDDAADSENDDNGPGVDAHMFDDLPVDTSQWSDVMRRRANGGPNGEFAFNPQPVNPNAAQHIFATRFSGGHGASTPSTEDLRITTVTPPPIDGEDDPPLAPHQPAMARTPSSREVLERVRARTPASTEPWAMSTAAAAAAVQKAIERQEIAIQARIRGVELAHEADEALDRAKEAAHLSAAIRRGETKPVPKNAVPASVMKRLAAERREREKKRKGSPEGSDALDSPASANGKLGSGKKGKQAKAAKAPPRPALDIKNDARAAEVAKMWRKSAELDACAVCGEPDPDHWDAKDEIIFCDGCNLQVHLSCYGMRKVPEGEWMCVGCSDGLDVGKARLGQFGVCALCPQPGGALARLDPPSAWDVAWESPGTHAHIACAECLPEVFIIRDKKNKPPLIDMSFVKGARMNLQCSLCDQEGACTQCAMKKCYASFHPLCARASGFAVERHVSDGRPMMFCKTHSGERWLEQRRVTAGKPAKDLLAKTEGATAQAAEATEEAAVNAEVIEEDAVGVGKSKFLSLNGTVDAVKPEPEREESGDGYAAAAAAAATATRLWDGFAPFIADKRERSRFGKVARKLLADSGMDQKECGRLAALDASAGEAEASRAVRGAERAVAAAPPPETPPTLAPGAPAEVAANAAAAQSMPWRVLRAHQRAGVDWLSARHLAGVGSIVCDRVGAGKRLTVLSHLMHLRDSMGVKGSHLLVCQPETIAAWTSELNRWCPRLRAVTLSCPADERNPAKAAILRAGADLIIVPTNVLVEAKAAEAKAAEAAEAAEAKAAEAPVETDEARAAARAAEDEEAAAAAAVAEASSSKKSKKTKKKKKKSTGGGGGHARKPEEDGVLPSSLTKLTFHTVIVDVVGDAAEDALPELARSEPHARVKFSRAIVVARDTINARGGVLRAALSILFPAVFDAVAAIAREGDDANDEYVDAEVLEQEWSATGGALRRMTTLRRVADLDVGADRRRVDETVIVARSQSSLFQERYSEILGEHGGNDDAESRARTLNELGALCATDLDGSGKLRALDSLVPRLRVERRAALVVSSSNSALDAAAALFEQRRVTHFRLDAPDLALGTRLHAVGRFPWSFKSGGGVRALLCSTTAAPDLTKEVVGKVDSLIVLDGADDAGVERVVHRLTGVGAAVSPETVDAFNPSPSTRTLSVVRLAADGTGETRAFASVADAKESFDAARAKASTNKSLDSADWAVARRGTSGARVVTLKEGLPVPLDGLFIAPTTGWFGAGEVDPVEAENDLEEDERAWATATARRKSRAHAASAEAALAAKEHDLTKYQWHERRCLNCRGEPERCVHIPPAFVGPDVAAKRLECRLCPRVMSFGCAALTQTPRGGWVCPQHLCHGCGAVGADHPVRTDGSRRNPPPAAAVLLRCVSCQKAFCDQCSGGAEFEAVETTPSGEWERNSFFLPARSYEYVKCQLCATKPMSTA